jgi:hypothetical protein
MLCNYKGWTLNISIYLFTRTITLYIQHCVLSGNLDGFNAFLRVGYENVTENVLSQLSFEKTKNKYIYNFLNTKTLTMSQRLGSDSGEFADYR